MQPFPRTGASRPASRVIHGESTRAGEVGESRLRLILIASFFGLCFVMLNVRLFEVSMMGSSDVPFKRLVTEPQLMLQREDEVGTASATEEEVVRYDIVDRNGLTLATTIQTASLVANPTIIRHEAEVARALQKIFPDDSYAAFHDKLMRKRSTFLYLRRHLTPNQQEAVNNLGVPGLFFEPDERRVYPYGNLFSHVIGYVGVDNQGLSGIEKSFDAKLQDPLTHTPLQLSLDLRVQSVLHDELGRAMKMFKAVGATGIVMDMSNGEILAMASLPDFDPHQPNKASDEAKFNRATLGVYEMGSTFKTFTMAAAFEYKTATMQSGYDASRPIQMGGFTIRDAHPEGRWLSVPEIFAYSSNIGTAKMALDIGGKRQRAFLKSLGFFDQAKLEVPEIGRPILPRQWPDLTTMTVAYGHGISVAPIQLLDAIAAVAGDGSLPVMTLLKDGSKNAPRSPRIVSAETTARVRELLRLVVVHGTGKAADAAGYRVGGKTGTAEKNSGGVYHADAKVASFVGVFPTDAPRYAMLVMVDEPKGNASTSGFATGGWISAPVVGETVQRIAPMLAVRPDFTPRDGRINALWAEAQTRAKNVQMMRAQRQEEEAIRAASF